MLVGDVLLCSGQSNMHMPVREGDGGEEELAHVEAAGAQGGATSYASIRVTTVGHCGVSAHQPHADFQYLDQPWAPVAGAAALGGPAWGYFSAACWHAGKAVFTALGRQVPLGLVSAAWRGTPIQAWMTPASGEQCAAELAELHAARLAPPRGGATEETRAPAPPSVSHTPLPPAQPAAASNAAAAAAGGAIAAAGGGARRLWWWSHRWTRRRLAAAGGAKSRGRSRRRRRHGGGGQPQGGGGGGTPRELLSPSPLAGGRCDLGASERPTSLGAVFNGLIHPLTVGPLALRAVLWYQGESNTGGREDAALVRCALPALILDWRARFGRAAAAAAGQLQPALLPTGAFSALVAAPWERPAEGGAVDGAEGGGDGASDESARDDANALGWYFVQLAPWVYRAATPVWDGPIAPVRAAQLAALSLPRTAFATAADLGDVASPLVAGSIHPRGKRLVGTRLARAVLAMEYGARGLPWRGPMVRRAVALAAAAAAANASSGDAAAAAAVVVQFHAASCAGSGAAAATTTRLQLVDPGGCPLLDARRTDPEYVGGGRTVAPAAAAWIRCGGLELQCSPGAWVEAVAQPFALPPGASLPAPPAALAAQLGLSDGGGDGAGGEGACLLRVAPRDAALAPGACARPLRVRYGDGNWPLLSIYDAAGLPAVPFDVEVM